jgi:hypothetical protein
MPSPREERPRQFHIGEQTVLFVTLALILGWVTGPLVRGYRLHGDDFAPVFYSSAPYFSIGDWGHWFTEGWSRYFLNYEGWPALGTDFVRPVVNLGLYLQGMLAPALGDPAYLVGNYLALIGTVLIVDLLVRRHSDAGVVIRLLVSLSVGLSPVWYPDLTEAAFATNAYACFFAVASMAVLDPRRGVPQGRRLWVCLGLQVLAVWSHETAVVMPLVSAALLVALVPDRPRVRQLIPFCLPVLVLLVSRVLVHTKGGVYALQVGPLTSIAKRLAGYLFGPPIPFELTKVGEILGSGEPAVVVFAYGLAILANLALVIAVAVSLRARPSGRRFWALIIAFFVARLPGVLVRMETRFLGIGLVIALLVFLALTERGRGRQWRLSVAVLLIASQAALLYAEVFVPRDRTVAMMQRAGAFFDMAGQSISTTSPDLVVLVNDDVAYYASRAMVEMASWPLGEVTAAVINSHEGDSKPASVTQIIVAGETLTVNARYAPGQRAFFAGAVPNFDMPANGFVYEDVERLQGPHAQAFVASGTIEVGRTLVLGVDPSDGSFLEPALY